ncbi:MAG: hypothetical protein JXA90_11570, partial [Planctomycetes bacterium]|nr:hypothetical protein [Planctomycetota bacterium]
IKVWNYNEVNLTARGAKRIEISGSASGEPGTFKTSLGAHEIDRARSGSRGPSADPRFPQTLEASGRGVRFIRFDIASNHAGVVFPASDASPDNAFVGLSEVRFFSESGLREGRPLPGVRVSVVSSELRGNFDRRAQYLVDGSGLEGSGWDLQGMPFYGRGVAYSQRFSAAGDAASGADGLRGRCRVHLPAWRGSVASVRVNGEAAGHIAFPPYELDITDAMRPGENEIEVTVIGTLRNTLGPHHAGAMFGKAWPHMFQVGPEKGPPPGDAYSTEGYGLFEPMELLISGD